MPKQKRNTYNKEFYICCSCGINLCPLCKGIHDNSHKIINYDKKNYICFKHLENFTKYCNQRKLNLCLQCELDHKYHNSVYFGDIIANKDDIIGNLNNLKNNIHKFKNAMNDIIQKIEYVKRNINIYYKISSNVINNYNMQNRNYQILQNINEFNQFNLTIIKDINNISKESNILNQFSQIINIYYKMNNKLKNNANNYSNNLLVRTQKTFTSVSQPVIDFRSQPDFRLFRQGAISPNEVQEIVLTAMEIYVNGIKPFSNNTLSRIKKTLGGDWIAIIYQLGKPIDFNFTHIQGTDFLYFTLDNLAYQVCRLR